MKVIINKLQTILVDRDQAVLLRDALELIDNGDSKTEWNKREMLIQLEQIIRGKKS